jgi:hypothetical protein
MALLDQVLHRFRLRRAGFILAEKSEAGPSLAVLARTRALIAELRMLLGSLDSAPRGVLERTLKRYDGRRSPSTGFERELQFKLLLGIKELERPAPNVPRISVITKDLGELLDQLG